MEKITEEYVEKICSLYGDFYDDSIENSSIGGDDWAPGKTANHKSLHAFREELSQIGVHLSTGKIRKILITGGRYSTELSRSVAREYERYASLSSVDSSGKPDNKARIEKVAEVLDISPKTVSLYLPYEYMAYNMENRSDVALAAKRYRDRLKAETDIREEAVVREILSKALTVLSPVEIQTLVKAGPEKINSYLENMEEQAAAQQKG